MQGADSLRNGQLMCSLRVTGRQPAGCVQSHSTLANCVWQHGGPEHQAAGTASHASPPSYPSRIASRQSGEVLRNNVTHSQQLHKRIMVNISAQEQPKHTSMIFACNHPCAATGKMIAFRTVNGGNLCHGQMLHQWVQVRLSKFQTDFVELSILQDKKHSKF